MVPLALIFSLFAGLFFAGCARAQFAGGFAPWGRELWAVLSFAGIIVWPVALYFFLMYPGWSWLGLLDPGRLPWGMSILLLLGCGATLMAGYLGGWALLRRRRERIVLAALCALGIGMAVLLVAEKGRFFAPALADAKLGWTLVIGATGVCAATLAVGLSLREQGKRSRVS